MKFNKILSMALMFPALAALYSCAEEYDYTPATFENGQQVYFPESVKTNVSITDSNNSFLIDINRVDKSADAFIELKYEADEATAPLFEVPSVVSFAEGSTTAQIECKVVGTLDYDVNYKFTLSVANAEDATQYGWSSVEMNVVCPAPWKSLGMGKMTDAFIYDDVTYFNVEIQQNELNPNIYRIVNPYDQMLEAGGYIEGGAYKDGPDKYFEFEVMPAGTDYQGTILDKDYVIFNDVNTGYWHPSYEDDVIAIHPYRLGMALDLWNYNVVLDYQENGLPGEVSIAPYYYIFAAGGGWNKTTSTTISVLFPGYVKADYSATVDYAGIFTSPDEKVYAVGNLALGADATDVKAIVMPQDVDAAAVADAIAAGELEAMPVEAAGRIEVPFDSEELGGSKFQIIVVVLVDGVAKNVSTASFEYYGGGATPWQSLGIGYFTDDIVTPMFFEAPLPTYEVEILESNETPGLYRIMNPYSKDVHPYGSVEGVPPFAPEGMYLEVNAIDAEGVYVDQQALGMDWGYGEMAFITHGARYLASNPFEVVKGAGYLGKVAEGVISFPVFTASNGTTYQGIIYMGSTGYYAGMNSKVEIVLPGANAFARNMAIAKSNLNVKKSFSAVKAEMKLKKMFNQKVEKSNVKL